MEPTEEQRERISARLARNAGRMTTATVAAMEERHHWFGDMNAQHRSWITLVAREGIDGFLRWFSEPGGTAPVAVFDVAPRALLRRVSLQQTVDLVRTTIEVCEEQIRALTPDDDRETLSSALLHYSREVAFAAASVYARAAEMRGTWDVRLEAMVVDALVRGEADDTVLSRASTLGWRTSEAVCAIVGAVPEQPDAAVEGMRETCEQRSLEVLVAVQGERIVLIVGGKDLTTDPMGHATAVSELFGPGPVVVGGVVDHIVEAGLSAREAIAGVRAAPAWAGVPRVISAADLLPERVLSGDERAAEHLVHHLHAPLREAGGDLWETASTFLDQSGSVEGTARALFVHPNTVRYRLKRIREITGHSPTDAREAYALRLALTLGRLRSL